MVKDYLIGIDPSLTHTGIVVLDRDLNLIAAKPIISKPPVVNTWRTRVARRETVNLEIMHCLGSFDGRQQILVEDYASLKYTNSAIPTVELGATLRTSLLLAERSKPVQAEFVAPTVVKKFITGSGSASKSAVITAVHKRYGVDFGTDDNLYDAYSIARLLAAILGLDSSISLGQKAYAATIRSGWHFGNDG